MRIWHTIWDRRGMLYLWGQDLTQIRAGYDSALRKEDYSDTDTSLIEQSVNSDSIIHEDPSVFSSSPDELASHSEHLAEMLTALPALCGPTLLRDDLMRFELDCDGESEQTLLLPEGTTTGAEFWNSDAANSTPSVLEPLQVPVLEFDTLSALNFLSSLPDEEQSGVRFGPSLTYWIEATKFLLELLAHGRMLPTLQRDADQFTARWNPVFSTKDAEEKCLQLAEAMPLSGVAVAVNQTGMLFDRYQLLQTFLSSGVDSLVRTFLRRTPLVEDFGSTEPSKNVGETFLRALSSAAAEVTGPISDIVRLEGKLQQWGQAIFGKRKRAGFSLALKLREPPQQEGPPLWPIELLLHVEGDYNHTTPFATLWRGDLGSFKHLNVTFSELEEVMLRELARGAQIYEPLYRAMEEFSPTGLGVSTAEAYELLRSQGALLRDAGITVQFPDWWEGSNSRLGLRLELNGNSENKLPKLGLNALLDFSWKLSIGDEDLTPEQCQQLLESSEPLIFVNGKWVELPQQKLLRTQKFLREQESHGKMRLRDLLRIALGISHDEDLLPVVGYRASGWIEQLLEASSQNFTLIDQPAEFIGDLRKYQREGLSWFALLSDLGVGGCLADDMGLGKTIQLLALLLHERNQAKADGQEVFPTLLVVPMSILGNWYNEAERFAPTLTTRIHHGANRLTADSFLKAARTSDLFITTYSIAHRDEALLSQVRWGRIALDEAQNIKNLNTKQTKAIRRITFRQLDSSEGGPHRVALTGTPLENHLEELWSIFDFLNPGFLGDLAEFRRSFAIPIERYRDSESAARLSNLVRPFLLRRVKSDPAVIEDLPEKIEIDEQISLLPEQAALYQRVLDDMLPQVDSASGIHRKGLVLTTITRLKQICDHPALYLKERYTGLATLARSGKVRRLEELLETILAEKDKVLIFSQFAQMGELLKPHLEERFREEVLFLHGGLPRAAREKLVARFQEPEGPRIFLLSLKAGGYGLNLTEANQVIHFDQWWNPAVQDQATDRAYRIGQKRSVQVRRFICKGTLEERIAQILAGKRELAAQIVGSTKNIFTELSTDELRQLLRLDPVGSSIDLEDISEEESW